MPLCWLNMAKNRLNLSTLEIDYAAHQYLLTLLVWVTSFHQALMGASCRVHLNPWPIVASNVHVSWYFCHFSELGTGLLRAGLIFNKGIMCIRVLWSETVDFRKMMWTKRSSGRVYLQIEIISISVAMQKISYRAADPGWWCCRRFKIRGICPKHPGLVLIAPELSRYLHRQAIELWIVRIWLVDATSCVSFAFL